MQSSIWFQEETESVMTDESSILVKVIRFIRVDSHVKTLLYVKQTNEFHCAAELI